MANLPLGLTIVLRSSIALALLGLALLYLRGWRRLQLNAKRLLTFWAGLGLTAIAFLSPLNYLATQYFSARVTYDLLLLASIPGLLMASVPLPVLLAGLPKGWQGRAGKGEKTAVSPIFHYATQPSIVLLAFVSAVWLWYDPIFHEAALRNPLVRLLEAVSLLGIALLYWWHIMQAAPRWHKPMPPIVRIVYTFLGALSIKLVGGILIFTMGSQYDYPATFALFNGLILTDKVLGTIIVWTFGGVIYSTTAVFLLRDWFRIEEEKPDMPRTIWDNSETLIAPHLEKN